jgi:hypothetical protein
MHLPECSRILRSAYSVESSVHSVHNQCRTRYYPLVQDRPSGSDGLRRVLHLIGVESQLARLSISSASRAFLAEIPRPPRAAAALAAPRQKRSPDEGRFGSPSQKLVGVEKALAVAVQGGSRCGFPQTIYLGLHTLRVGGAPVAGAVVAGAAAACRGGADHRGQRAARKRGGQ